MCEAGNGCVKLEVGVKLEMGVKKEMDVKLEVASPSMATSHCPRVPRVR